MLHNTDDAVDHSFGSVALSAITVQSGIQLQALPSTYEAERQLPAATLSSVSSRLLGTPREVEIRLPCRSRCFTHSPSTNSVLRGRSMNEATGAN